MVDLEDVLFVLLIVVAVLAAAGWAVYVYVTTHRRKRQVDDFIRDLQERGQ